ncbi:MAG: ribbon-helix-helix domain-containing protein [Methanomassiliicoccales archaeon]|nr:ribbon-helix-helix domain-containing protein [Methanomassiliicoccales archaeon]
MVRQREKLTVTVPQELIDWLDEMVKKRVFASRSHGVELCIMEYRERHG